MKPLIATAALLIALAIPATSHATPKHHKQLDYILIDNPHLSTKVAVRAMRGAIADINSDGVIKLGMGKRRIDGDPFKFHRDLTSEGGGFYRFSTYFVAYSSWYRESLNPDRLTIVIDPPIKVDGTNYMGGYAWIGGAYTKPIAYCNGMEINDAGLPRFRHLEQCIRHEIYHLYCATHDETRGNIMHHNALSEYEIQRVNGNGAKLPLTRTSKKEILDCIRTKAKDYRR